MAIPFFSVAKLTAAALNVLVTALNANAWQRVVPTSVTGGTISALGTVTFTALGATTLTIDGIFDDTVAHKYRIIIETTVGGASPTLQLRDSTPATIATGYDTVIVYNSTTTATAAITTLNTTSINLSAALSGNFGYSEFTISNPNAATSKVGRMETGTTTQAGAISSMSGAHGQRATTVCKGIILTFAAATNTGRVTILRCNDI